MSPCLQEANRVKLSDETEEARIGNIHFKQSSWIWAENLIMHVLLWVFSAAGLLSNSEYPLFKGYSAGFSKMDKKKHLMILGQASY